MLVLSRHSGEEILLKHPDGTEVVITILERRYGGKVRVGIAAPSEVLILRRELEDKMLESAREALATHGNETGSD